MVVRQKKLVVIVITIIVFAVTTGFIFMNIKDKTDENLQIIQLEDFQNLTTAPKSNNVFVYVGRDSCPTCTTVYPTLCEIVTKNKLNMFYYSTELDREVRPETMNSFLNSINIDHVPMVIEIANGVVLNIYDGEEFVKIFSVK